MGDRHYPPRHHDYRRDRHLSHSRSEQPPYKNMSHAEPEHNSGHHRYHDEPASRPPRYGDSRREKRSSHSRRAPPSPRHKIHPKQKLGNDLGSDSSLDDSPEYRHRPRRMQRESRRRSHASRSHAGKGWSSDSSEDYRGNDPSIEDSRTGRPSYGDESQKISRKNSKKLLGKHSRTSKKNYTPNGWPSHEEDSPKLSQQKWSTDGHQHHSQKEEPLRAPQQRWAKKVQHSGFDGFNGENSPPKLSPIESSPSRPRRKSFRKEETPQVPARLNGPLESWSSEEFKSANRSQKSGLTHKNEYQSWSPRKVMASPIVSPMNNEPTQPSVPTTSTWEQVLDEEGNVIHFNSASGAVHVSADKVRFLATLGSAASFRLR